MEKILNKEAASIATKLLLNIYGEDFKAAATIIDAEAKVREGDESGYTSLVDALSAVRDSIQELIDSMIYGKE